MAVWPYSPPEIVQAALRAATPTTIAQAPEGVPVLITGCTAQPGPGGPLSGPFSGAPCVWYRTLFWSALTGWQQFWQSNGSAGIDKYMTPNATYWTSDYNLPYVDRYRTFDDQRCAQPFVVADATGSLTVETPLLQLQSRTLTANRRDDGHDGRPQGTYIEWVMGPGQPVELLGAVRRQPDGSRVFVPDQGNVGIISTLVGRLPAMREYAITGRVPEELIKTRTDRLLASPNGVRKLLLRSYAIVGGIAVLLVALLVLLHSF